MGAHPDDHIFPAMDQDELLKAFSDHQNSLVVEFGNSSSNGTLSTCAGLKILPVRLSSAEEAYDYLIKITKKRGSAYAVKISPTPDLTVDENSRLSDLNSQCARLFRECEVLNKVDDLALQAIKGAKSARISCSNCKSSLTRSYLSSSNCPVCQQDGLRSHTQKDAHTRRVARHEKQVEKTNNQVEKIYATARKRSKPDDYQWYVQGLAAS